MSSACLVFDLYLNRMSHLTIVSNNSYDDEEDQESEETSIYYCAIWTHPCSFVCYDVDLQFVGIQ